MNFILLKKRAPLQIFNSPLSNLIVAVGLHRPSQILTVCNVNNTDGLNMLQCKPWFKHYNVNPSCFNQARYEASLWVGGDVLEYAYTEWIFSEIYNWPTQFYFIAAVNRDKQFFHVRSNVHVFPPRTHKSNYVLIECYKAHWLWQRQCSRLSQRKYPQ